MDDQTRAAIGRLTANERECLRRRLLPQTAKEMALELGVSPHAVEKRLKVARAKLGVSSSLAAARLVAAAEWGGETVPSPADLATFDPAAEDGRAVPSRFGILIGAALMIFLAALALAFASRQASSTFTPATPTTDGHGHAVAVRKATQKQANAYLSQAFDFADKDRSGFLEPGEVSAMEPRNADRDRTLPPAPPVGRPDPAAERKWIAKMDTDRDGRISRDEYIQYMLPWTLLSGIPNGWDGWASHPAD